MSGIFLRNATIVAITFIGCVGAAESRVLLGQQLDERQKLLAAIYDHSNTGQNLTQMNPGKDFSVVVGDRHSFIPLHPKKTRSPVRQTRSLWVRFKKSKHS